MTYHSDEPLPINVRVSVDGMMMMDVNVTGDAVSGGVAEDYKDIVISLLFELAEALSNEVVSETTH